MAQLLRRFVCGRCGATAPIADRPYLQCDSCGAVSDYDFGVARQHADWPAHEAALRQLFAGREDRLGAAQRNHDRLAYATTYVEILEPLISRFPALYPKGATEASYRARLAAFHAAWQAITAIEQELVEADMMFRHLRGKVAITGERATPSTLWPLIELALAHFDGQQRFCDATPPGPPDDFAANYVRRFGIAATIAEWLPRLDPHAQRELVTRMGVSHEYVDSVQDVVACPNCSGSIRVTAGFLEMACPYCGAEIEEARPEYREVEATRGVFGEYDEYLKAAEHEAHQRVDHLEVLDGEVTRDGKQYRMITFRACFPHRKEDFWEMFDVADSRAITEMLAWVEMCARDRKIPNERLRYREHPRCNELPEDAAELARRLADIAPGGSVGTTIHGKGLVAEVVVDGTLVRLAYDARGKRTQVIRRWLGHA